MPSSTFSLRSILSLALLARQTSAHIALWHPSMFGWDESNINQNDAVTPLADMTFNEWWFHGYMDKKPAAGKVMELPAGGTFHGEVTCNKAQTTWVYPDESQLSEWACNSGTGPMHTTDPWGSENPTNVMGCGLSIAYTSDETTVKPEDFTVFSVAYDCPWRRKVDFPVPSDLPACPPGGCLCSWGWIHSPDSGSEQIYHLVYRCNVTGATNTKPLPAPKLANKCDYPSNTGNCTVGGKQPHYWLQKERNNNFQGYYDPPYYNGQYGFMNGAQTDLFAASGVASNPRPASSTSTSSSSSSSAATMPAITAVVTKPATTAQTSAIISSASQTSRTATTTTVSSSSSIVTVQSTVVTLPSGTPGKICQRLLRKRSRPARASRSRLRQRFDAISEERQRRDDNLLDRSRIYARGLAAMQARAGKF